MNINSRIQIAGDEEQQLTAEEVSAILAERATKLALAYSQVSASSTEQIQLIAFSRENHHYGVELRFLTEIRPLTMITPVPGVPAYYSGVIHIRGDIVAVIDLGMLFGGAAAENIEEKFAVVVTHGEMVTALLADSVDDVHDILPSQIHPPLATFSDSRERYIRGLTEAGLSIIDVEKLLGDDWLWVDHNPQEERR